MKDKNLKVIDKRHEMSAVEREATDSSSPNAVILKAMDKNYSPELIEKMMDLNERWEKNEAKKAYVKAMAEFKKNPPKIEKISKVSFQAGGREQSYSHADLADAAEKINKSLSENGLSAGWNTKQDNGTITVTCTITHELGHSESTFLTAAPDTSGSKNAIQAIGSTISYLERYTLFALTGLAAHGQDNDGSGSEPLELINEDQLTELSDLIEETKTMKKAFLKSLRIKELSELPSSKYESALKILKARK